MIKDRSMNPTRDERRGVFFEHAPYETDLHRPCLEEKCQRLYADYRGQ